MKQDPVHEFSLVLVNGDGEEITPTSVAVNDEFSFKADYSANFCGKVVSISGSTLVGTLYSELPNNWKPLDYEQNIDGYLWIPTKPFAGAVKIGSSAVAFGLDNTVNEVGSMSSGVENLVDGRYGFSSGRHNVVTFCATSHGKDNKATGYYSSSEGL